MSAYTPRPGERAVLHTASTGQLWLLVMNPIGQWQHIGAFDPDGPHVSWYPHVTYEADWCRSRPTDRATQEWAWNLLDVARNRDRLGYSLADLATHEVTVMPQAPRHVLELGPLDRPAEATPAHQPAETEELCLF